MAFPFASSSHITSPSNSSSSFPTDELRSHTSGYHPRDEVDDYTQVSDSDSDLRSPKRLRLEELTERQSAMRINQENGVGGSTNGVSLSNGDSQNATNGTNMGMQSARRQELVRLMVQAMQDMGYRYTNIVRFLVDLLIY